MRVGLAISGLLALLAVFVTDSLADETRAILPKPVVTEAGAESNSSQPHCPNCCGTIDWTCPSPLELDLIRELNRHRIDSGQLPLSIDIRLQTAARCKSLDAAACFQLVYTCCSGTNYLGGCICEWFFFCSFPIAQGIQRNFVADPVSVIDLFLSDSAYRAILLSPAYKSIGAGYAFGSGSLKHNFTLEFGATPSPHTFGDCTCCEGITGNVDDDIEDAVDISDLTVLIDYLFISNTPIACREEANVDGDSEGGVDISDLTVLIDFLFINNSPIPGC